MYPKYRTINGIIINSGKKVIPPSISNYISHIWNEESRQWDKIDHIAAQFYPKKETFIKIKPKTEREKRKEVLEAIRAM
jgi:hypothetical protein